MIRPPLRIVSIVGTRPEAIKLAPVALAAAARGDIAHRLVTTGQHGAMCHDALADFGLAADAVLSAPAGTTLAETEHAVTAAVAAHLAGDPPALVLVQGDTTSALAGARAAAGLGIPVGHVEAGLRSHDLDHPFPEERNRIEIDRLAALLFAPTPGAAANLRADPTVGGETWVTGNTGIDALLAMRARLSPMPPDPRRLILVTCHRRENIGAGIDHICAALRVLAARGDVRILLPLHGNPAVRGPIVAALGGTPDIALVEPLSYRAMVQAMCRAHLILTDSGGVQEEAATLGTPALVLRDVTERPEGVAGGGLALVGTATRRIVAAATRLLDDPAAHAAMARPDFAFGHGHAAALILDACVAWHVRTSDRVSV